MTLRAGIFIVKRKKSLDATFSALLDMPHANHGAAKGKAMRLATLILPTMNNAGVDQTDTHIALQSQLIAEFGGFTVAHGNGGWRDDSTGKVMCDPVAVYSIAMDQNDANDAGALESIARFYGHMAGQVCVMVTHASGEVVFIDSTVKESV